MLIDDLNVRIVNSVRCVCRSPCRVSPSWIGTQHASARPTLPRPRTGTPGHEIAETGTG